MPPSESCLLRGRLLSSRCFLQPTDPFVPRAPCQDFPGLAGNIPGTPKASLPLSLGQLMVSSNVFPGWALWAQLISILRGWGNRRPVGHRHPGVGGALVLLPPPLPPMFPGLGSPHHLDPGHQLEQPVPPHGGRAQGVRSGASGVKSRKPPCLGGRREEAGPELALAKKDEVGKTEK